MRHIRSKVAKLGGRTGLGSLAGVAALALVAAGCGTSSSPSASSSSSTPAGHAGGTFTILANSAFGVADPA